MNTAMFEDVCKVCQGEFSSWDILGEVEDIKQRLHDISILKEYALEMEQRVEQEVTATSTNPTMCGPTTGELEDRLLQIQENNSQLRNNIHDAQLELARLAVDSDKHVHLLNQLQAQKDRLQERKQLLQTLVQAVNPLLTKQAEVLEGRRWRAALDIFKSIPVRIHEFPEMEPAPSSSSSSSASTSTSSSSSSSSKAHPHAHGHGPARIRITGAGTIQGLPLLNNSTHYTDTANILSMHTEMTTRTQLFKQSRGGGQRRQRTTSASSLGTAKKQEFDGKEVEMDDNRDSKNINNGSKNTNAHHNVYADVLTAALARVCHLLDAVSAVMNVPLAHPVLVFEGQECAMIAPQGERSRFLPLTPTLQGFDTHAQMQQQQQLQPQSRILGALKFHTQTQTHGHVQSQPSAAVSKHPPSTSSNQPHPQRFTTSTTSAATAQPHHQLTSQQQHQQQPNQPSSSAASTPPTSSSPASTALSTQTQTQSHASSFAFALHLLRINTLALCLSTGVPATAVYPIEAILLNLYVLQQHVISKCRQWGVLKATAGQQNQQDIMSLSYQFLDLNRIPSNNTPSYHNVSSHNSHEQGMSAELQPQESIDELALVSKVFVRYRSDRIWAAGAQSAGTLKRNGSNEDEWDIIST